MKRILKYFAIALLGVIGLLLAALGTIAILFPKFRLPPPDTIESTPVRLLRGRYLAENVAGCIDCHTKHDWSKFGGPVDRAALGAGGDCYTPEQGLPGTVCPSNITPDNGTGIGSWSDGQIFRTIREGIDNENQALFPLMPFDDLAHLSDEDVRALVVYLRQLPAVARRVPERQLDFPVSVIFRMFPKPLGAPVAAPEANAGVQYGQYLTEIAGCHLCHTAEGGAGTKDFAGGNEMIGPWGRSTPPNITPDPESAVGRATKEQFIGRFTAFATIDAATKIDMKSGSPMPWLLFSGMSEQDLGSIYDYLRTVKPIHKAIPVK